MQFTGRCGEEMEKGGQITTREPLLIEIKEEEEEKKSYTITVGTTSVGV